MAAKLPINLVYDPKTPDRKITSALDTYDLDLWADGALPFIMAMKQPESENAHMIYGLDDDVVVYVIVPVGAADHSLARPIHIIERGVLDHPHFAEDYGTGYAPNDDEVARGRDIARRALNPHRGEI